MENHMTQMKGQSAIEYLTTYGWMLLVIAIVGGAIFTTVQSSSGISQTTGFTGEDVQISNFGLDSDDNLSMEIRAASTDQVVIDNITISGLNSSEQPDSTHTDSFSDNVVAAGETKQFEISNTSTADTSNQFDIEIVYDTGELEDVSTSGTLTGNLYINNSES